MHQLLEHIIILGNITWHKTIYLDNIRIVELLRIELRTSRMQSERSTTELQPHHTKKIKKINLADKSFYFSAILQRNAGHRYIMLFYIMHLNLYGSVAELSKALV